jgi:uncharacterized protein (TIGR02099 family)
MESLPLRGLHALAPWAWRGLVLVVLLFASYVALGRFTMTQLPALREPLLAALNDRLPFRLEARSLTGSWSGFSPELSFGELSVSAGGGEAAPLRLGGGDLRIDLPASIGSGSLQLSRLEMSGLSLAAVLRDDGSIELRGFSAGGGALQRWLETFLPNVQSVRIRDSRLQLTTAAGDLDLALDLALDREGSARHLRGRLEGDVVALTVDAAGVGNPLRPLSWSGDVFAEVASPDLTALSRLWARLELPFTIAGQASAQFWLAREGGESRASLSVDSTELRLAETGGAWSLPIDALSFRGALDQRERHSRLIAEDFHVERAGEVVDLDRVQFDWWEQALRVRATRLELDYLPSLLGAAPGIPAGLRAALPDLAPRGQLGAVELRLDDLARPAATWQLRSTLAGVSVDSWRGTPALRGVTGYLELGPAGGRVQLDSAGLSMLFPKVYREPLTYDDAVGELRLAWDRDALTISSGLLQVRGEEGRGSGLFALDVPLTPRETGIELDLLVGLVDSKAEHRARYLPFRLPAPLLAWLDDSIGQGEVPAAGFIWRGSTRKGQDAHRTSQLYLKARGLELAYDPAWPALDDVDATVWVDDARAFARADRASILGATVQDLVLRVQPRAGGARLDVAAGVIGDARAAQPLLSQSPLAGLTGGVFADWSFAGAASGDLAISLELGGDPAPPWVDLSLGLDDVSARIAQADLPVTGINGQLTYRSRSGFAGSRARGQLLGGHVELLARDGTRRGVDLDLDGRISVGAVADWLELPQLRFARGEAGLAGRLLVDDAGARLEVASELTELTLDAPAPFGKGPGQPLPLRLSLPLESDPRLRLDLGERLRVAMDLTGEGVVRTAAQLGGALPDADRCDRRYCLAGELSILALAQWQDFARRYLRDDADDGAAPPGEDPARGAPTYLIDDLAVGELALGERSLGTARVTLEGVGTQWQGSIDAPWLRAALVRPDGRATLLIDDLDVSGYDGGGEAGQTASPADLAALLPPLTVRVGSLRSGDEPLGSLSFDLEPRPGEEALYVSRLTGELWGARLADPWPGMLRWAGDADTQTTALELDLAFDDIGAVLSAAGYLPSLESKRGRAAVRLAWPGSPGDFDLAAAEGELRLSARDGRVLEERPGPLALIGFLNFAEILRGLSLSHMFESGIPFETADAELHLRGGKVDIVDLAIDGAASEFIFQGMSDLTRGEVEGELVVTLPVANNLPWVAALAGGPAVAAGVFVVSKVFEKQVNRMSSAVYAISGSVDAPRVEFLRLFDDELSSRPPAPSGNGTGGG